MLQKASQRIKNHLSYKLGSCLIEFSKKSKSYIFLGGGALLAIKLLSIARTHKKEQKLYKQIITLFPDFTIPPLNSYPPLEILEFQNHLSYKLGSALIKARKDVFKGGYLFFFLKLKRLKKEFIIYNTHKNKLLPFSEILNAYSLEDLEIFIKELENLALLLEFFKDCADKQMLIKELMQVIKQGKTKEFLAYFNSLKLMEFSCNKICILALLKFQNLQKAQDLQNIFKQARAIAFDDFSLRHFEFIIIYSEEILAWLHSKTYKQDYAFHLYPPLLNPQKLNLEFTNNSNKINAKPLQNLSYKTISADLAWDMNLPLSDNFHFIYISPHGVGAAAFLRYLNQCCDVYCAASWVQNYDAKNRYILNYQNLNQNKSQAINISELCVRNIEKYLYLFPKEKPILFGTRDPIALLRHYLARDWSKSSSQRELNKTFNLSSDFRKYIDFLTPSSSELKLDSKIFELLKTRAFIEKFLLKHLQSKKIKYLDMSAILPQNSFKTLEKLAPEFGFKLPKQESKELFKIKEFRGYVRYLFPLRFIANKKDLKHTFSLKNINVEEQENFVDANSFVFVFNRILPKDNQNLNIIKHITKSNLCNDVGIYIDKKSYEVLKKDKAFYNKIRAYLKEFCKALKKVLDETEKTLPKEKDVLVYLTQNKALSLEFKNLCEENLKHLKQTQPQIIASWKYYQEFLKFCKDLE